MNITRLTVVTAFGKALTKVEAVLTLYVGVFLELLLVNDGYYPIIFDKVFYSFAVFVFDSIAGKIGQHFMHEVHVMRIAGSYQFVVCNLSFFYGSRGSRW